MMYVHADVKALGMYEFKDCSGWLYNLKPDFVWNEICGKPKDVCESEMTETNI